MSSTDAARARGTGRSKAREVWALSATTTGSRASSSSRSGSRRRPAARRIGPGVHVLDVAAGTGNVALAAARAGASVVASDLTPALIETGRRRAAERGLSVEWVEADAEALPFADAVFDAVVVGRRDVRARSGDGGGGAAARVPPGRRDRARELDAGELVGAPVRRGRCPRPAATRTAARALGRRGPHPRAPL